MKEMTNHEAIEGLNGLIKWEHKGNSPSKYKIKMFRMSIEALEKQVPKKPNNKHNPVGNYWTGECPICSEFVDNDAKFCSECAQALDWSNE